MYNYMARDIRIIDGDTIEATVDLGFNTFRRDTFRLFGINAPEIRAKEPEDRLAGQASKHYLSALLDNCSTIKINTIKDHRGKYGRMLCVLIGIRDDQDININKKLVDEGYAEAHDY